MNIDADDLDRLPVHGRRPQRLAGQRAIEEPGQRDDDCQVDDERHEPRRWHQHAAIASRPVGVRDLEQCDVDRFEAEIHGPDVRFENPGYDRHHHQRHAEHKQERRGLRLIGIGKPRNQHIIEDDTGKKEQHRADRKGDEGVNAKAVQHREREKRTGNDELAVRKIDDSQNARKHVQRAAYQGVDDPEYDPADDGIPEQHLVDHDVPAPLHDQAPRARKPLHDRADDAARHEQDQQGDDEPEQEIVQDRKFTPDQFIHPDENDGSDHGPGDRAKPARHGVDHGLRRHQHVEGGDRDRARR